MPKAKTDAAMGVYECVSPIEHDGQPIAVGDVVEFPVEVAEPLVASGALKAPEPEPAADPQV
jgi:hypothetical protein